ncbi:MAG: hypothetical protein M1835_005675 [Candelina submexicana]|nr:MAG: hypothetical protein M1835_005675 [Candelina submexicana]
MTRNSSEPLLREDRRAIRDAAHDEIHLIKPSSERYRIRHAFQQFLTSKTGHSLVLMLVTLSASCVLANMIIALVNCEQKTGNHGLAIASMVLGTISMIVACVFVVELLAAIFAFGISYLYYVVYCFDAIVVITTFVVSLVLRGTLGEIARLVVLLRLWRVFRLMYQSSTATQAEMDDMEAHIDALESENGKLKKEVNALKANGVNGMDGHP